jgi:AraC-like DNA-binding protein
MGFPIPGNPSGAQVSCSGSLERSLRHSRFWDEPVTSGLMLRFVDLAIDRPGWIKVKQSGCNICCFFEGSFRSSYFRSGDADANGASLRVFSFEGDHAQLVHFTRPTRHRVVQLSFDPQRLSAIAGDLDEDPDALIGALHRACHSNRRFSVYKNPLPRAIGQLIEGSLEEQHPGFFKRMNLYGRSLEILSQTLDLIHEKQLDSAGDPQTSDRIDHAIDILTEQFASVPSIPWVAGEVGLGEDVFQREFKAKTGETPSAYLTRVRMKEAKHLITKGELPVSGVGHTVGYNNHAAFSRAFRRHYGKSPTQMRIGLTR